MCAGALVLARVERLVFGAPDPKFGACGSIFDIVQSKKLNHRIALSTGILKNECVSSIESFGSTVHALSSSMVKGSVL